MQFYFLHKKLLAFEEVYRPGLNRRDMRSIAESLCKKFVEHNRNLFDLFIILTYTTKLKYCKIYTSIWERIRQTTYLLKTKERFRLITCIRSASNY